MRILLIFFLFTFSGVILSAQHLHLSGTIQDEKGNALPGATVALEGKSEVTFSDSNGHFHFDECGEDCIGLKITYVGFEDHEIHLDGPLEEELKIVLHPAVEKLDEVIIRDNYSELRKNENSLNVEIINDDFIRRNFSGSLMQSISRLPGVSSMDIGAGQSKPVVRGLSFNRIAVVENGIKHEGQQWGLDHGLEIDQFGVERLEVIKGPASLIHGSDAIGGVIDIQAPRPPHKNSIEGSVQGSFRSNNNYLGNSIRLGGRKTNWFFDSRFTMLKFSDYRVPADTINIYSYLVALKNNRLRNTAGEEHGAKFNFGYLSDNFSSTTYLSWLNTKGGLFANAHGLEPRLVDTMQHDQSIRDIQFPSQDVSHYKIINRSKFELEKGRLEIEFGYQFNDRKELNNYINHGYMPELIPEDVLFAHTLERGFEKQIYTGNLRSSFALASHSLHITLNAEYQDNDIDGYGFIIPAFNRKIGGLAIYDKWTINDNWLLQSGIRFDLGQIQVDEYIDWFPSETSMGSEHLIRAHKLNKQFSSPSWAIGVNYNRDHLHLKLNAGQSFRMPTAKELGANGVNYHYFAYEKGNPNLKAEVAYQLDALAEWHHEKWALQISGFGNYFPNYIYLNPTSEIDLFYGAGNQIFEYQQSEVIRFGGELHAHINLFKSVKAGLIAEYIFAEQLSGEKKGFTLPFSPPPSATLSLQHQPNTSWKFIEDLYFNIDLKIHGAQNRIVPPERKTTGSTIVNIGTGTKFLVSGYHLEFNLGIQNLFNTSYLNHTSFYRIIDLPEAGRNISLSLKIPFHTAI